MGIIDLKQRLAEENASLARRRKMINVPPEFIVGMLNEAYRAACGFVTVIEAPDLPASAVVTGVYYAHEMRCFQIHVVDQSFDEVPDGTQSPEIGPPKSWKRVELVTEKQPTKT